MNSQSKNRAKRAGCRDIWNAFMCAGARYGVYDIPYCPTTATSLPNAIITWEDAKAIYKRRTMTSLWMPMSAGILMTTSSMARVESGTTANAH